MLLVGDRRGCVHPVAFRYRRPYRIATDSAHRQPVASNILDRRFNGWKPNEAWLSDITFVATDEARVYLAVIMDLASRKVIGWAVSDRIRADLVCDAPRSAYWAQRPTRSTISHSDRGSQYASRSYRQLARDFGMVMSVSRRENCWDNLEMESLFKTLKVERIYRLRYRARAEARLDIVEWIEGFFNRERILIERLSNACRHGDDAEGCLADVCGIEARPVRDLPWPERVQTSAWCSCRRSTFKIHRREACERPVSLRFSALRLSDEANQRCDACEGLVQLARPASTRRSMLCSSAVRDVALVHMWHSVTISVFVASVRQINAT
jgi:hypothetical protein